VTQPSPCDSVSPTQLQEAISLGVSTNVRFKAFYWGKIKFKKCSGRQGAAVMPWPLPRPAEAHAAVLPARCHALAGVVLCRSARRRAVALWLAWWRSIEAHAAVLSRPGWRGGALQKRTPPCCCSLATAAPCRNTRRRVVALWLAWWRSVEAHAAALLCSGWRGGAL
jgi:hypothetical protein